jgi:carbamate kinase
VAGGHDIVITHGNGPQVGNLLLKNELAADIVPAMPLDWCVAQTQATIGFTMVTALEQALLDRNIFRPVVTLVSRVLVDLDDAAFSEPTKPIGRWRPDGTRRLVPSPTPIELLDRHSLDLLINDGAIVIANGGGGIPMVRHPDGSLAGVEAVIDKDRSAALLATSIGAERLVILTDVDGVAVQHGEPAEHWLADIGADDLDDLAASGEFPSGSMGPKVEAVVGFVRKSGGTAAIGALANLEAVVAGTSGTQIH